MSTARARRRSAWTLVLVVVVATIGAFLAPAMPVARAAAAGVAPEAAPTAVAPEAAPTAVAPGTRPNILFVLTDDLSNEEMAALPRVNALIGHQGVTFEHALVNVSLCCPSRTSILRGQYAHNTHVLTNGGSNGGFEAAHRDGVERSTIATWLHDAGYRTGLFGKYLNGYPNGVPPTYVPPGWDQWESPVNGLPYTEFDYTLNVNGAQVRYGSAPADYGTDVYTKATQAFVTRAAADHQPFFAYVSLYAPHNPAIPAPRDKALYPGLRAPHTASFAEKDLGDKPSWMHGRRPLRRRTIAKIDAIYRQRAQSLAAVDVGVASLVATLQGLGELDDTYIVFASDNGYHFGQHGLAVGKGTPYEEDVRVPLMIRGPGVSRDARRRRMVGNTDLAPTMAAVAGVTPPSFVDGRSLLPLLHARGTGHRRRVYLLDHWRETYSSATPRVERFGVLEPSESGGERRSGKGVSDRTPVWHGLRTRQYKYVEYDTGERELYDLGRDPAELDNIVDDVPQSLVDALHFRLADLKRCREQQCRDLEDEPIPGA